MLGVKMCSRRSKTSVHELSILSYISLWLLYIVELVLAWICMNYWPPYTKGSNQHLSNRFVFRGSGNVYLFWFVFRSSHNIYLFWFVFRSSDKVYSLWFVLRSPKPLHVFSFILRSINHVLSWAPYCIKIHRTCFDVFRLQLVFRTTDNVMPILPEHLSSPRVLLGLLCVAWTLVFYVVLCRSLFVLLSFFFWLLCCLSFFDQRILITPLYLLVCVPFCN